MKIWQLASASVAVLLIGVTQPLAADAGRPFEAALSLIPSDAHFVAGWTIGVPALASKRLENDEEAFKFPDMRGRVLAVDSVALRELLGAELVVAVRLRSALLLLKTAPTEEESLADLDVWIVFKPKGPIRLEQLGALVRPGYRADFEEGRVLFVDTQKEGGPVAACGGLEKGRVWLSSVCTSDRTARPESVRTGSLLETKDFRDAVDSFGWPSAAFEFANFTALMEMKEQQEFRNALAAKPGELQRFEAGVAEFRRRQAGPFGKFTTVSDGVPIHSRFGPTHLLSAYPYFLDPLDSETITSEFLSEEDVRPDAAVEITKGITPPELVTQVEPELSEEAKVLGLEGRVTLRVVVGVAGAVEQATIVRSTAGLDETVLSAVRQWKYRPALRNGAPVRVWLFVTESFK